MSEALMQVKDLDVRFDTRDGMAHAVAGVSLDWAPGEILGVVGESGCGKSTLARAMMGLQEPAGGEISLRGKKVASKSDHRELRRHVQLIFQDPYQTLNPRQRVRAIIEEPLIVQGIPSAEHEERVKRALDDVGLDSERYLDRYPYQLSGGQRQRVAIAAALVLEPDGLICDEPVSMLDTSVRSQILGVLLGLQRNRGLGLIFITHDLSLAWSLCDRIAVMYLGRVVEEGSAVDVIERPQHPYTQALVTAIPVPTPGGGGRRELLTGELPDATAVPSGCRFHPRCPKRFEPCDSTDPSLIPAGGRGSEPHACCMIRRWVGLEQARAQAAMAEPRWRDLAGPIGVLEPGPRNAITDVAGVRVGHAQAASGASTGVTVVAPPVLPAAAGVATVNGTGELGANLEIAERGRMETPVYLCGTHALGTVTQAAIIASGRGPEDVVIPVVGECDDGDMADSRTVGTDDVAAALGALGEDVGEGSVGSGTGMSCFDFPGGIGTASRRTPGGRTVGVLLMCNFGRREYLDLLGTRLEPAHRPAATHGSCIAICATDAPAAPHQLRRLALRPLLGLSRAGSYASEGSGEIALAFTAAAEPSPGTGDAELDELFAAAYESAHEAVLNCLVAARPGRRLDGSEQDAFPIGRVRELAAERASR